MLIFLLCVDIFWRRDILDFFRRNEATDLRGPIDDFISNDLDIGNQIRCKTSYDVGLIRGTITCQLFFRNIQRYERPEPLSAGEGPRLCGLLHTCT